MLNQFYMVLRPRRTFSKCEIADVVSLKDAKVALWTNFCMAVKNIFNIIKLWRMRHLPLEGKTTFFKCLVLSKIVYLALLTIVPKIIIKEMNKIHKMFLWSNKKVK